MLKAKEGVNMQNYKFQKGQCLYENPLSSPEDIADFKMEGELKTSFKNNQLILENHLDAKQYGDLAHWLFWCPQSFPDEIIIEWEFSPLRAPGLCMLFFAATGRNGEDLFDASLPKRKGVYPEYHSGAINALHLSYFRKKWESERSFCTCNLRKSYGFHLVATGADPIPSIHDATSPYHLQLIKYKNIVQFSVNDLVVLEWADNGVDYGSVLKGGKIGFRQMAPMKAAYSKFKVYQAHLL